MLTNIINSILDALEICNSNVGLEGNDYYILCKI